MFESDDMKQFFGKCSSAGNSDFKKALSVFVQGHGTDCADGRDERDDNPILWRIGAPAGKTRGGRSASARTSFGQTTTHDERH